MAMSSRVLPGILLAVGTASATSAAAAETHPSIVIRVDDRAHLSAQALREAERVASGIYGGAGVNIAWKNDSIEGAPAIAEVVIVPDVSALPTTPSDDSMGMTSNRDGARTHVAFVFYDRVERFAAAGGADVRTVLGAVIAHELGHLLLPLNAHSDVGVMKARWDPRFVPRAGRGVLNFSPEQARLLRARLATRDAVLGQP
jgi:hypothetical protein